MAVHWITAGTVHQDLKARFRICNTKGKKGTYDDIVLFLGMYSRGIANFRWEGIT